MAGDAVALVLFGMYHPMQPVNVTTRSSPKSHAHQKVHVGIIVPLKGLKHVHVWKRFIFVSEFCGSVVYPFPLSSGNDLVSEVAVLVLFSMHHPMIAVPATRHRSQVPRSKTQQTVHTGMKKKQDTSYWLYLKGLIYLDHKAAFL